MPACQLGWCASVLACQHGLCVNVSVCQLAKSVPTFHFYVPTCHTACQCFNLERPCAKWHANFSTWMPTYQNTCQVFKDYSYEMLREYLYLIIIQKILHFIWYHSFTYIYIFYKFFLSCALVRNWNIERPCFYTLQVTRAFLSEYCDFYELWSAWVGDTIWL